MTLTICTSGINAGSSMPGNPELQAVTNPPDNSTQQKSNDFFSSAIFHALYSTAVGVCTTFVKNRVVSPLNDPGKVFLREHCFNNMSRDESDEYGKLTPFTPLYLTEIAVTSTAFFVASGGLCKVYKGCKSIYDRLCHTPAYERLCNIPAHDAIAMRPEPEEV
ncbi:hypothetical protein [Endozoicomonas sp. GU-1]|uniref:hypothetical protein n=1 Tax=Endozoicomonas sp. GU-1 TaxID=3009078 RepID=UPI0022B4F77E|nr:hypothetical protein [Endozoicomonas sp. GU-1]WBA79719.1 hypothetical protein O2T12_15250 [Endozoicomonas sp. GU-1]WBA87305.1 hypothetical protein O3276_04525 [Endozoicomonas sp. GU-1]